MAEDVISEYETKAVALIPRYNAIDTATLYAPVIAYFPKSPARVLDIGAGTGRDARWFSRAGYTVTAVEPVKAFRESGKQSGGDVEWQDGRLPDLTCLSGKNMYFDLILMCAVWHHLDPRDHFKAFQRVVDLMANEARIVMSLRHSANPESRVGFDVDVDALILTAKNSGLETVMVRQAASSQAANVAAGVTWTWVVFQKR